VPRQSPMRPMPNRCPNHAAVSYGVSSSAAPGGALPTCRRTTPHRSARGLDNHRPVPTAADLCQASAEGNTRWATCSPRRRAHPT
jgi:hypothetical protein